MSHSRIDNGYVMDVEQLGGMDREPDGYLVGVALLLILFLLFPYCLIPLVLSCGLGVFDLQEECLHSPFFYSQSN